MRMHIPSPNFTQTPNDLFDHWLPHLSEGELKVLLVIMRKTFGWHKKRDRISSSQLSKITGLTEPTVRNCANSLAEKGVILKEVVGSNGSQATYYEIVVHEDSNNLDRVDQPPRPGRSNPEVSSTPQKKPFRVSIEEGNSGVTTTTKESEPVAVVSSNSESFELLKSQGFDDKAAQDLQKHSVAYIQQKIALLQQSNECSEIPNPLGWLRNAIEYDWTPRKVKEVIPIDEGVSPEKQFANKEIARKFRNDNWANIEIKLNVDVNVEYVQIKNDKIYYDNPRFVDLFNHACRKL